MWTRVRVSHPSPTTPSALPIDELAFRTDSTNDGLYALPLLW